MITLQAECVVDELSLLGEGPVWDEQLGEVFWVDIDGHKLHRWNPTNGTKQTYELEQKAGCAVPAVDGSWILGLQDGFHRFDLDTGRTELLVTTPDGAIGNRLNDGKCDPSGRFWAGTISGKGARDGFLYVLDNDGTLSERVAEVGCSNGLAWTADNKTLYYIDTPNRAVHAFDYEVSNGTISNRRTVIDFAESEGMPDGMSIDVNGNLWIGHWGGWQLACWDPRTGEKLVKVELPAKNVTSCAFGGANLDELYITTARVGNPEAELEEQPLAGGLFRVKVDVKGLSVQRASIVG